MPRKPRIDLPESIHHVTALAGRDDQLFREPADQRRFMQHLRQVLIEHDWRCNAYCLMGTHFHLIPYTVSATLSVGMRRLLGEYAQWFNWKYDRRGHLFSSRFSSRHITDEAYLLEAHRYVALNPVRAGLCDDPADGRGVAIARLPDSSDRPTSSTCMACTSCSASNLKQPQRLSELRARWDRQAGVRPQGV